jgi:hypothetical protein
VGHFHPSLLRQLILLVPVNLPRFPHSNNRLKMADPGDKRGGDEYGKAGEAGKEEESEGVRSAINLCMEAESHRIAAGGAEVLSISALFT